MTNSAVFEINGNPRDFSATMNGAHLNAMEVELRCGERFRYEPQQSAEVHAIAVLDMVDPVHIKGKLKVQVHYPRDDDARTLIHAIGGPTDEVDLSLTLDGRLSFCLINGKRIPLTAARVRQTSRDQAEVELYYSRIVEYGNPTEYRILGTLYTPEQRTDEGESTPQNDASGQAHPHWDTSTLELCKEHIALLQQLVESLEDDLLITTLRLQIAELRAENERQAAEIAARDKDKEQC